MVINLKLLTLKKLSYSNFEKNTQEMTCISKRDAVNVNKIKYLASIENKREKHLKF